MKCLIMIIIVFSGLIPYSFPNVLDSAAYPQVGQSCPDFTLTDVEYYTKSTVSLSDFKGKWLILDFWGEYCASCVESFSKLDIIQKEFDKEIQTLLVGIPYKRPESIRNLYEMQRIQKKLSLPIVYDKELSEQFGVDTYPHIVIVDPDGIVRYITYQFDRKNISDMISNKEPSLPIKYSVFERSPYDEYDTDKPFLINGNGGDESDHLFRSILSEANELTPPVFSTEGHDRLEILGFSLGELYKYAYGGFFAPPLSSETNRYGKVWPHLIFETADTAIFYGNYEMRENLFSYSAHVSEQYFERFGDIAFDFKKVLQNDLAASFPYEVSVEKRMMPYNELRIDEDDLNKIKSNAEEYSFKEIGGKRAGFEAVKAPFAVLISRLSGSIGYSRTIPLIYSGPDIKIDIILRSVYYEDRVKELADFGFSVVKREKAMDVIVVRNKTTAR